MSRYLFAYSFEAIMGAKDGSFRGRVAWMLRKAADRIDKGNTISIRSSSVPALTPKEFRECVAFGCERMGVAIAETARAKCVEQVFRDVSPARLFQGDE